MGTLRFFEEVVSFKIRRTFGFADYISGRKIPADLYFKLSKAAFGAILRPYTLRGYGSTPF